MNNKLNELEVVQPLRQWVTPHLLRLNQADGTDKHLALAESVGGTGLVYPTCTLVSFVNSGGGGGGVCGPS